MSMQNTSFWPKVGKIRVDEMREGKIAVGKMGILQKRTFLTVLSTMLYLYSNALIYNTAIIQLI